MPSPRQPVRPIADDAAWQRVWGLAMMAKKPVMLDQIDVEVGATIRRLRRERRLSQIEMGKALGISFQQVQKYENGRNRVSAGKLHKIAHILGAPVSSFFPGRSTPEGVPEAVPLGDAPTASARPLPEEDDLRAAFALIRSRKVRKRIVGLVEAIVEELRPRSEEGPVDYHRAAGCDGAEHRS